MTKVELLAPAGDLNTLKVAIEAGADAVYISGQNFGARSYAKNFSDEELAEAVIYAHLRCKKVYVTVNTLIFDDEFDIINPYLAYLVKINVDAVIVQDLGLIKYIKINYPSLVIHASTQINIYNLQGAKNLNLMGVERIVLARETNQSDIKEISQIYDTEVFIPRGRNLYIRKFPRYLPEIMHHHRDALEINVVLRGTFGQDIGTEKLEMHPGDIFVRNADIFRMAECTGMYPYEECR